MYYQEEAEKKERRKIIAVATISVVVILILIVAIIVVATKKSSRGVATVAENTSAQIAENVEEATGGDKQKYEAKNESEAGSSEVAGGEATGAGSTSGSLSTESSESSDNGRNSGTQSVATQSGGAVAKDDIPSTGPEEALPLALMAGVLVAYLTSRKLALSEEK